MFRANSATRICSRRWRKSGESLRSIRRSLLGYHVVPPKPELVGQRIDEGYRFIAYSTDMILFSETCRSCIQAVRAEGLNARYSRRPQSS